VGNNVHSVAITVRGRANIALSPALPFRLGAVTAHPGEEISVGRWNVTNIGDANTGAFTAVVGLASDTTMGKFITQQSVGGPDDLAPGASYTFGGTSVLIPATLAPGDYFIGAIVDGAQASGDTALANNKVSVRVTITSAGVHIGDTPFSYSAPDGATMTSTALPDSVVLHYAYSDPTYSSQTFEFATTAIASGPATFRYDYSGLHSWYAAYASLEAFVEGPGGTTVTLVPNTSVYDNFYFTGTTTLNLNAGYRWGIRARGYNYDSSQILLGTIVLTTQP
jgi:hypothetical protein